MNSRTPEGYSLVTAEPPLESFRVQQPLPSAPVMLRKLGSLLVTEIECGQPGQKLVSLERSFPVYDSC